MIFVHNVRFNGAEHVMDMLLTQSKAFHSLVFSEIGFGTTITELTPTRIVCRTNIFGCRDTVEFTGNESDMAPLVRAAAIYIGLRSTQSERINSVVLDALPTTRTGGYRFSDVSMFSGMLAGMSIMKLVALLAMDINPTDWPREVTPKDTLAAIELQLETGEPALSAL